MVWLRGDQLYSRVKSGPPCDASVTDFPNLATVSAGKWHKVVIQASWKSDKTGFFKLWFDDKLVTENYNLAITVQDDGRPFQFRTGLYANGWHDSGHMVGSQGSREIWDDQIGAGSTFQDADPDGWS